MKKQILVRLARFVVICIAISFFSFFIIHAVEGDPVTALLGQHYTEQQATEIRARLRLDKPLLVQYVFWAGSALRGDLGTSMLSGQDVFDTVLSRAAVTLRIAGASFFLAMLCALPLGVLAAIKKGSWLDTSISIFGLTGISVPHFWLATLCILLAPLVGLPAGGYVPWKLSASLHMQHLVFPVVVLALAVGAVMLRMSRASVAEALSAPAFEAARLRGVVGGRLYVKYALLPAIAPILTIAGVQIGYLLAGTVVIEHVFGIPGMGSMILQAIANRDYPLFQAGILLAGVSFAFVNLLVDVLCRYLNPRLRFSPSA